MQDPVSRLSAALSGRYEIERPLGQGGMATVYLARDVRHQRKVALKVLRPELAAIVGAERFLTEIRTTASLQHPHILPLHDSGEADGLLFYVMPYVDGETLRERLDREHQLPVDEAVRIATNVAEALDYAHRHGVIHRDIKPANILLQDGKPVVSDFGIALALSAGGAGRLTETGLSLGTPHYMSPEQATGDLHVGAATDIYALGCVLYEMLVGEPPYTGSTPQAVLGKIVTSDPDPVTKHRKSVPPNVDAAIRKALEKVPADRFPDGRELARALADAGYRHGQVSTEAVVRGRQRLSRRDVALLGVGVVLGVAGPSLWSEVSSRIGPFAYQLVWVDRQGNESTLPVPIGEYRFPRVSPDGGRIAVSLIRPAAGALDLWVFDAATGAGLRLTHDDEFNGIPIWTADGRHIFFSSTLLAPAPEGWRSAWWGNVYSVPADGSAPATRVTATSENQAITGITPDGSILVYTRVIESGTHWDLMALPSDGSREPTAIVSGRFRRGTGDISPDGRWLAYRSDEAGTFEIYVEAFPGPGPKVPVSIGGGNEPVWSHDSRELFYRRDDGMMMAAAISEEPTLAVRSRTPLFSTTAYRSAAQNPREYHVAPDGRFLMLKRVRE